MNEKNLDFLSYDTHINCSRAYNIDRIVANIIYKE